MANDHGFAVLKRVACTTCLLLLSLNSRALATWESGNSTCGVYGWPVPPPPEGATLLQVHAVIRHGDRTPAVGQPCWPNDSSKWFCNLNRAELPMDSDTEYNPVVPRVHRIVFKVGEEILNGNCSLGQLTTIGYSQHVMNGMALKTAYVDSGFLGKTILSSDMYFRSDDIPRTLQSAQALLWGMYPPQDSGDSTRTEVVDIITMDDMFDDIKPNPRLCPKYGVYQKEFANSKVWKDHLNVTKALLHDISVAINYTIDQQNFYNFVDCLLTYQCHNLSWPKGMTESLYNRTLQEILWESAHRLLYPTVQQNAQVGIGFLLKEMWKRMNASVEGEKIQKFFLYSGHGTTVMPILVAFQEGRRAWAPYASMILMELYKVSSGSGHAVRLIYNGEVLQPPFCSGSISDDGLCDYKVFSDYFTTITPTDPAKQCAA